MYVKDINNTISSQPSGSRNNSLTVNDGVEITRQFLATNNKVINRGDSFRRRERAGPGTPSRQDSPAHAQTRGGSHRGSGAGLGGGVEIRVTQEAGPRHPQARDTDRCFRVVFLGGREVGKTSIVDQFMSSEHADVYENNNEEGEDRHDNKERCVLFNVDRGCRDM